MVEGATHFNIHVGTVGLAPLFILVVLAARQI